MSENLSVAETSPTLMRVLESAGRLQAVIPDAVLVGGSAAALYAGHRESLDHDHVLADLRDRFDLVLEAVESTEGWITNRITPGKIILGQLGDIEAGVRQMIRKTPLEIKAYELPSGRQLNVPTAEETLRIKAYLAIQRNQTRDYLDIAALANRYGLEHSAAVLAAIDRYYGDQANSPDGVASQLVRQLSAPRPADARVTRELAHYKGLRSEWWDWQRIVDICRQLADHMVRNDGSGFSQS